VRWLCVLGALFILSSCQEAPFDSAIWTARTTQDQTRCNMVKSLEDQLLTWTREDVRKNFSVKALKNEVWIPIGTCTLSFTRGVGVGYWAIQIVFENDKVRGFKLRQS